MFSCDCGGPAVDRIATTRTVSLSALRPTLRVATRATAGSASKAVTWLAPLFAASMASRPLPVPTSSTCTCFSLFCP